MQVSRVNEFQYQYAREFIVIFYHESDRIIPGMHEFYIFILTKTM